MMTNRLAIVAFFLLLPLPLITDARVLRRSDPTCGTGIRGPKAVCCHRKCGVCGGSGCSKRPGGGSKCCISAIITSNKSCKKNSPPCVVEKKVKHSGKRCTKKSAVPNAAGPNPADREDDVVDGTTRDGRRRGTTMALAAMAFGIAALLAVVLNVAGLPAAAKWSLRRNTLLLAVVAIVPVVILMFQFSPPARKFYKVESGIRDTAQRFMQFGASVTLSGKQINYTYPKQIQTWTTPLVVGVLSAMTNREHRDTIRETWAANHSVVFMVASNSPSEWTAEMEAHNDLVVLHHPESYCGEVSVLPYKTQVFFHAAANQVASYDYALKTDDDSFVHVGRLMRALDTSKPDYWGKVHRNSKVIRDPDHKWYVSKAMYAGDRYPEYCSGAGYVLSKALVACAVTKVATFKFFVREDVATGLLAGKCGAKPVNGIGVFSRPERGPLESLVIQHYVKTRTAMLGLWGQFSP